MGLFCANCPQSHKERNANIFLKLKSLFEMMSNTTLVRKKVVSILQNPWWAQKNNAQSKLSSLLKLSWAIVELRCALDC
jgi:hypothetical protein